MNIPSHKKTMRESSYCLLIEDLCESVNPKTIQKRKKITKPKKGGRKTNKTQKPKKGIQQQDISTGSAPETIIPSCGVN